MSDSDMLDKYPDIASFMRAIIERENDTRTFFAAKDGWRLEDHQSCVSAEFAVLFRMAGRWCAFRWRKF
jgi:hypothetical protein